MIRFLHLYELLPGNGQETLRDGREHLIPSPDQIHGRFQDRRKRPGDQPAAGRRIDQFIEGQQITQPFPGKNRAVVGKPERTFKLQLFHPFPAPAGQIVPDGLF